MCDAKVYVINLTYYNNNKTFVERHSAVASEALAEQVTSYKQY